MNNLKIQMLNGRKKISIENAAASTSPKLNDMFPLEVKKEKRAKLFPCLYFL